MAGADVAVAIAFADAAAAAAPITYRAEIDRRCMNVVADGLQPL